MPPPLKKCMLVLLLLTPTAHSILFHLLILTRNDKVSKSKSILSLSVCLLMNAKKWLWFLWVANITVSHIYTIYYSEAPPPPPPPPPFLEFYCKFGRTHTYQFTGVKDPLNCTAWLQSGSHIHNDDLCFDLAA